MLSTTAAEIRLCRKQAVCYCCSCCQSHLDIKDLLCGVAGALCGAAAPEPLLLLDHPMRPPQLVLPQGVPGSCARQQSDVSTMMIRLEGAAHKGSPSGRPMHQCIQPACRRFLRDGLSCKLGACQHARSAGRPSTHASKVPSPQHALPSAS